MAGNKYLNIENGETTEKRSTQVSLGPANANEIPALDNTGRLDPSLLPIGVGPEVKIVPASEVIAQGKYVNLWVDAGVVKARLADNSNGRVAFGWAYIGAAAIGDLVTIYYEGTNAYLTGLTPAVKYWLGTAGGVTATPPTFAGGAQFIQTVGRADSTTSIVTDISQNPSYLVA